MTGHTRWSDIRAGQVARAGGEDAVAAGKQELLNELIGHRLAEVRRARGLTQQDRSPTAWASPRDASPRSSKARSQAMTCSLATPPRSAADSTKRSTSTTATSPPSHDLATESA